METNNRITRLENALASGDAPVADDAISQTLFLLLPDPTDEPNTHLGEDYQPEPPESSPILPHIEIRPGDEIRLGLPRFSSVKGDAGLKIFNLAKGELQRSRSNSSLELLRSPSMSLSELSLLLQCQLCRSLPMTSLTVHMCYHGHQICGHCFGKGNRSCRICKVAFLGRNERLEKFLQHLRQVTPELFPQDLTNVRHYSVVQGPKAVQHSSHRALECPHLTCNRLIAANGFLAHFKFEHPNVPVLIIPHDLMHEFLLPHRCLQHEMIRVISVIEVDVADRTNEVKESPKTLAMPVRRDAVVCALLCAKVVLQDVEFMAVWCSCLYEDLPPLIYTLRVHSSKGHIYTFNGLMTSLLSPQDPKCILQDASCLLLSVETFNHLCEELRGSTPVSIQFHFTEILE